MFSKSSVLYLSCGKGLRYYNVFRVLRRFSTLFRLYHGVSWVSYQFFWSIYPDTSKWVVRLTQQPWATRRAAITTMFEVFGTTRPGIEYAASRIQGGRSTTTIDTTNIDPFSLTLRTRTKGSLATSVDVDQLNSEFASITSFDLSY